MEMFLHHVQVSGPAGCEAAMRDFYVGVLGMSEVDKPEQLRARGGAWFRAGTAEVHVGIEEGFVPARKAHPGIAVGDVDALARAVGQAGAPVTWDENIPGLRRFHTVDPVGNRLEFQQAQR
ncbi:VOC family protein [Terracoccus sp. 273MFTsu3.1]|uniref:VOC family protein n=1 Tax=Terracoccus sp. 273MFTsu3.1 TaxID=1172188 RepID=UPI0003690074|nr:VOC family protein [Terracoccus sp. 273MFTsu3.1]